MDGRELHLYRVFHGHGQISNTAPRAEGTFHRNPNNFKHITVFSNRYSQQFANGPNTFTFPIIH